MRCCALKSSSYSSSIKLKWIAVQGIMGFQATNGQWQCRGKKGFVTANEEWNLSNSCPVFCRKQHKKQCSVGRGSLVSSLRGGDHCRLTLWGPSLLHPPPPDYKEKQQSIATKYSITKIWGESACCLCTMSQLCYSEWPDFWKLMNGFISSLASNYNIICFTHLPLSFSLPCHLILFSPHWLHPTDLCEYCLLSYMFLIIIHLPNFKSWEDPWSHYHIAIGWHDQMMWGHPYCSWLLLYFTLYLMRTEHINEQSVNMTSCKCAGFSSELVSIHSSHIKRQTGIP